MAAAQQNPSLASRAAEIRVFAELAAWPKTRLALASAPKGDGHAVMVLPGLWSGDWATAPLREFLSSRGYDAAGWEQGTNTGVVPGLEVALAARLADLHRRSGRKVSLIGWSLGGVFARELARENAGLVRQVITLGSPFRLAGTFGMPGASSRPGASWAQAGSDPFFIGRMRVPPPVPATSIFSRGDGVVPWEASQEQEGPESQNLEVEGSHYGLGINRDALRLIADRLAQPEGRWRRYQP